MIKKDLAEVLDMLDHKYLNELEFFKENNPSSENIARYIFENLAPKISRGSARLARGSAWESETARASYAP